MKEPFAIDGNEGLVRDERAYDVAIVGGGAAGLAAARTVAAAGLSVVLLEARDRLGGRVRWATLGAHGETVELGAEFIHGPAPETRELLRDIGDRADEREGEGWNCDGSGALEPESDEFLDSGSIFADVSALDADETVDAYLGRLKRSGFDRAKTRLARMFVEGFDAADPARASVYGIADEWNSGVDAQSARPSRGYAPVIEQLRRTAEDAGAQLRTGSAVDRIGWSDDGVRIATDDGTSVRARATIVTLPVGVLRHSNHFDPPLPAEKQRAISSLESGDVVRLVLAFKRPFWEELDGGRYRDAGFFRCAGGAFGAYWTQVPQRSRCIVAWAGGPRAAALLALSRQELVRRATLEFGAMLGDETLALEAFDDAVMHDWSCDPFARGAYSYVLVGGANAREELGRPVRDVLFFAGEATALAGQGGTVNGAIVSGIRAAREVLLALARTA